MKQQELERILEDRQYDDAEWKTYLEENPILRVEMEAEVAEPIKETAGDLIMEGMLLDYIEEMLCYDGDYLSEEREALLAFATKRVMYIACFYLREGVSYMDLVQEGIIGALKGIDAGSDCLDAWIIREMYEMIAVELRDLKFAFKGFLKAKRDALEEEQEHAHTHHHHHHAEGHSCSCGGHGEETKAHSHAEGHECSCGHEAGEEHKCCGKHHKEDLKGLEEALKEDAAENEVEDKNKVLEKLLHSDAAIDAMEGILEESLEGKMAKPRLSQREIEVLDYYFALMQEKRHSIFEIEEKLNYAKGEAEKIFEMALYKLSTVKGKVEL